MDRSELVPSNSKPSDAISIASFHATVENKNNSTIAEIVTSTELLADGNNYLTMVAPVSSVSENQKESVPEIFKVPESSPLIPDRSECVLFIVS